MPFTGVFLFLYVASAVLFAAHPATYLIATFIGLALAVVFVLELTGHRGSFCLPAPLLWFLAFFCFCTFQMIWSPSSVQVLFTLAQLLVLAVIIVSYAVAENGARPIEYALYLSVICTFIYNIFWPQYDGENRMGSTLLNANAYAFILILGALFAMQRLLVNSVGTKSSHRSRIALILFLCLSWYGIIFLTVSRKGIIIGLAATAALVIYWVWQQPMQRRMLFSVLVVVVFGLVAYGLYNLPQFSRIAELSDYLGGGGSVDRDLLFRGSQAKSAVDVWLQHPWVGVGLDQFRLVSGGYMKSYSFNNYTELLANHGIVGFFAYVMVYVSAFVSLSRSFRLSTSRTLSAELFWGLIVLGILIGWDVASVNYADKGTWIMIGVIAAIAARGRIQTQAAPAWAMPPSAPRSQVAGGES